MNNRDTILKELQELCPAVANLARTNVYTVPEGYFEKLGETVIQFVREHEEPPIQKADARPFSVPQGYFDSLAEQILQRAKQQQVLNEVAEELNSVAPFLNTISKVPVFSVPVGYFESFNVSVPTVKAGKVVSLGRMTKVIRYAAAAIVIGIVALGGILFFDKDSTEVEVSSQFNAQEIKKLSDQEIIEYLNTTSYAEIGATNPIYLPPSIEDKSLLEALSEEEIEEYLKENPESIDMHPKEG